jgi:hypothetical protein
MAKSGSFATQRRPCIQNKFVLAGETIIPWTGLAGAFFNMNARLSKEP